MTPSTSPDSGLATLLAVQRKAFRTEGPPSAEERRADLTAVHGLLIDNRKAIARALREDFGARSAYETEIADIATTLHTVRFARRHLAKWMKPRRRSTGIWPSELTLTIRAGADLNSRGTSWCVSRNAAR